MDPKVPELLDSAVTWLATAHQNYGMGYYALYWALLLGAAAIEVFSPGRKPAGSLGPRFRVNFGFGLMTMILLSLPFLSEVALAELATSRGWGLFGLFDLSTGWRILLSFLAYDLCGYTIHRCAHRYSLLWRLHRVHHSDSDLDLSTYFRSHPLDTTLIFAIRYVLIVSLGLHPAALVLHGLGKQVTMTLGHANVRPRPRLSRTFAWLFVSPSFHAIHHSSERTDTDSNYGEVLSIWDRLFGTVGRVTGEVSRHGLGDAYDSDSTSLAAQLRLPFIMR